MKEITLQVPDGKRVEWKEVNGQTVLVLVDEETKDNRPVTERIKTFEDACRELDKRAESNEGIAFLLADYESNADNIKTKGTLAYMKLCIIAAALNEGWEPKFTEDEYRYFPWFYFYTKEEYDKLDDEGKGRCVLRSGYSTYSGYGFVDCSAGSVASFSSSSVGSRLAFRTSELAAYAGRQFIEEWADFMFKPRTGEELNGKSEAAKTTIDFNNNEDE